MVNYKTIEVDGGRGQDQNIEDFGDVVYTLITIQCQNNFSIVRMNNKTKAYLQRKFRGVSENELIERLLNCKIFEDDSLKGEIITEPYYSDYLKKYTTCEFKIKINEELLR